MKEDLKPFLAHLEDLRRHLVRIIIVFGLIFIFAYCFVDRLLPFLLRPVGRVVFFSPAEAFIAELWVAFFTALFAGMPYILFELWRFAGAGLTPRERRYLGIYLPVSILLFYSGSVFGLLLIAPLAMDFLLGFRSVFVVPMINVSQYIGFVGSLALGFGLVFELPVAVAFLIRFGIVTPQYLIRKRRHAVVAILIVSALITPPDCVTQILMAVPLWLLYETSIFLSRFSEGFVLDRERTRRNGS